MVSGYPSSGQPTSDNPTSGATCGFADAGPSRRARSSSSDADPPFTHADGTSGTGGTSSFHPRDTHPCKVVTCGNTRTPIRSPCRPDLVPLVPLNPVSAGQTFHTTPRAGSTLVPPAWNEVEPRQDAGSTSFHSRMFAQVRRSTVVPSGNNFPAQRGRVRAPSVDIRRGAHRPPRQAPRNTTNPHSLRTPVLPLQALRPHPAHSPLRKVQLLSDGLPFHLLQIQPLRLIDRLLVPIHKLPVVSDHQARVRALAFTSSAENVHLPGRSDERRGAK